MPSLTPSRIKLSAEKGVIKTLYIDVVNRYSQFGRLFDVTYYILKLHLPCDPAIWLIAISAREIAARLQKELYASCSVWLTNPKDLGHSQKVNG